MVCVGFVWGLSSMRLLPHMHHELQGIVPVS